MYATQALVSGNFFLPRYYTGMHTGFSMASISDIQDLSNKY